MFINIGKHSYLGKGGDFLGWSNIAPGEEHSIGTFHEGLHFAALALDGRPKDLVPIF
jgi:hypothetical protein